MRQLCGALLVMAVILACLVPVVRADSLELKNGNMVQGRYLGGTEHAVQFEVNGKIQLYDINQILSINFAASAGDGLVPSNSGAAGPNGKGSLRSVANPSCAARNAAAKRPASTASARRARLAQRIDASAD